MAAAVPCGLDVPAVGEHDLRMRVHQPSHASQGARRQHIVRGEQQRVVALNPLQQALVVGRDVAPVACVPPVLDARVLPGQSLAHSGVFVRRSVVEDSTLRPRPASRRFETQARR